MANGLLAAGLSRIDTMDCRSGAIEVDQRVRAGDPSRTILFITSASSFIGRVLFSTVIMSRRT